MQAIEFILSLIINIVVLCLKLMVALIGAFLGASAGSSSDDVEESEVGVNATTQAMEVKNINALYMNEHD